MKVRVIAEDNIIISNMMMMMISGGFSCSYILRSYFGCHDDDDEDLIDVMDDSAQVCLEVGGGERLKVC